MAMPMKEKKELWPFRLAPIPSTWVGEWVEMAVLPSYAGGGKTVVYYQEYADMQEYATHIWKDGTELPDLSVGKLTALPDWIDTLVCYGKLGGHGVYVADTYSLWLQVDEHNRLIRFLAI